VSDIIRTLSSVEQRVVNFYGDELTAVKGEDGHIYVVLSHLCDALGIDTQGQSRRVQRQPVLAGGYTWVDILSTQPIEQRRRVQVLRVDLVPLWLTGVNTKSIKDERARVKLERFQMEAAKVLWEAFQEGRLTSEPSFEDLLDNDTPAAQAYKMAAAIMKMARQQLMLEAQLGTHAVQLANHEQRLEELESTLGDPGRFVTPDQAMQISQAIKTIALEIEKRTKKNEYGAIYGQMYRQFGITSYKQLPADKFDRAMTWLTEWYQRITGATGDELPF
jgi:ferritin-like metal-binding protein YciE